MKVICQPEFGLLAHSHVFSHSHLQDMPLQCTRPNLLAVLYCSTLEGDVHWPSRQAPLREPSRAFYSVPVRVQPECFIVRDSDLLECSEQ